MNQAILLVLVGVLIVAMTLAAVATFYFKNELKKTLKSNTELEKRAKQIPDMTEDEAMLRASDKAKATLLEAEKKVLELQTQASAEVTKLKAQIKEQELLLDERERKLLERTNSLDTRFDQLEAQEKSLEQAKRDIKKIRDELSGKLEQIAKLTKEEAEAQLKQELEKDLSDWTAKKVKEANLQISSESDKVSQAILTEAMLNSATEFVSETTTTSLTIDDETLKGKIIGKDGRNIRAFEKLTGVDVIIDEAPNQVTISCFDPIRREVGAIAMQRLLKDGRVHPGTIEETVQKVKKELLKVIKKTGEEIAYETGFNDLPNEIIMLLGRFKYRFSYGQNLAKHTIEMVKIGEALAIEVGADVQTTKLACLLHDLGKVAPQEGKQHHHISAEITRKYYKDDKLINAIEAHHFDIDAKSVEAELVRIADAVSGARPGARRDSYDEYIKRVRALEDIANKHKGVDEAFAIHAGREVRVVVKPNEATDKDVDVMAYEIAKEIEETQNYPGVVKVTVIREHRAITEAK